MIERNIHFYIIVGFLLVFLVPTVNASIKLQNNNSQEISQIDISILGGTNASSSFFVCSVSSNTSFVQFYNFSFFMTDFQPKNITGMNPNDCIQANASFSTTNITLAGDYVDRIVLVTANESKQLEYRIHVLENIIWNTTTPNFNQTVTKGQFGQSTISIKNIGNVQINFRMTVIANTQIPILFLDSSDFSVESNGTFSRPFYYNLPQNITPQLYSYNITFFDGAGNSKTFPIFLNLSDVYPPSIEETVINPSEADLGQTIIFSARAVDDSGIRRIYMDLGDNIQLNFTQFNNSLYRFFYNDTNLPRLQQGKLHVQDNSGNEATKQFEFKVRPDTAISAQPQIPLGKVKYRTEREVKLMSLNKTEFLMFRLKSLTTSNPNATLTLTINGKLLNTSTNVVLDQAVGEILFKVKQNDQYVNVVDNQSNTTKVILQTLPENYRTDYIGEIELTTDNKLLNPVPIIQFTGRFDDYSVTLPSSIPIPFIQGEYTSPPNFSCVPTDTGAYDTSFYGCSVRFHVDTPSEDIGVVSTKKSLESERQGNQQNLTYTALERDNAEGAKWITWGILATVGIFFLIYVVVVKTAVVI